MGSNSQINLDYDQLVHCVNITYCSSVNKCFWKNEAMNTLVKVPFTQTRMKN